jgi:hypothetical protein
MRALDTLVMSKEQYLMVVARHWSDGTPGPK